jgi:hypothetical protein
MDMKDQRQGGIYEEFLPEEEMTERFVILLVSI